MQEKIFLDKSQKTEKRKKLFAMFMFRFFKIDCCFMKRGVDEENVCFSFFQKNA